MLGGRTPPEHSHASDARGAALSAVRVMTRAGAFAAGESLTRGFMIARVLEDRLPDALRFEALVAGQDPGSLYPGAGSIALAAMPVG